MARRFQWHLLAMAWWQRRHSDQSRIKRNAAGVRAWSLAMRRRISGALRATGRRDRGPPFVWRRRRAVETVLHGWGVQTR